MKKLKIVLSLICIFSLLMSFMTSGYSYFANYNNDIDNVQNSLSVKNQGSESDCLFYALTSAAESYCLKNNITSLGKNGFNARKLVRRIGESCNFGNVLYSSVNVSLGSGCYITGIENLSGRGERYIKQKVKENGAVMVSISLPESGMTGEKYYNAAEGTFSCDSEECSQEFNHAFTVVGWDDSFSADKFNIDPGSSGAWLCQNSYGTDYGKGGYFWLPYSCDFLYAASVEVSRLTGVISSRSSSLSIGYVAAVGIRTAGKLADASVEIISSGEVIKSENIDVPAGYKFISLDSPVRSKDITVKINGSEIPDSSVNKYYVIGKSTKLSPSVTAEETGWNESVSSLTVDIDQECSLAYTGGIDHIISYNADDNCYYVTPCDGYTFSDNISVKSSSGKDIDFSSCSDGRIRIKSKTPGNAFASGINILTGTDGVISGAELIFDEGQKKYLSADEITVRTYSGESETGYTLKNPGTEIFDVSGEDRYYAVVSVTGWYFTNPVEIFVNGIPAVSDYEVTDNEITAGAVIEIPEIALSAIEWMVSILQGIMSIFEILR